MTEHRFRAVEIGGGGFVRETGDAIVVGLLEDNDELQFFFPANDIPALSLLLSRIHAQNVSGKDEAGSLHIATSVEKARFLRGLDEEAIGLVVRLGTGVPISFAVPLSVAQEMREQLNDMLP